MELEKLGMEVNKKTRIYSSKDNIQFIGIKRNGKLVHYHRTIKKINKKIEQYYAGEVELSSLISSLNYLRR